MAKNKRKSNLTRVYVSYVNSVELHHVRIAPLETQRFPHGMGIGPSFTKKWRAEKFADDVDAYLKEAFKLKD